MALSSESVVHAFVSYAHANTALAEKLVGLLSPRCQILRERTVELRWDRQLLVGRDWVAELDRLVSGAPVGLFLVTPDFLASPFISRFELSRYLNQPDRLVVPVGVRAVDFERDDTKGLSDLQVYLYRAAGEARERWFADCRGENRHRFVDGLVAQLVARIAAELPIR